MKILAVETSCDETAAAVVEDGKKIISNVVASSAELHKKTGGIIPEVAARQQVLSIIPVINEALRPLNSGKVIKATDRQKILKKVDCLAVTVGPGLIGSLLVGVETVKTLAFLTEKKIIPVNHVLAHLYANFLKEAAPLFPSLGLVVSGGHTELFLLKSEKEIKWLGGTVDDAAGEAFDKTARLLGLGFPGGPAIAACAAKKSDSQGLRIRLPRPMIGSDNFNFSFSGLKTAVMREVNDLTRQGKFDNSAKIFLANEIQEAITDVLTEKTLSAAKKYKVKSILLGGGVTANKRLREKLFSKAEKRKMKVEIHIPPPSLCTDNAAYIASFAFFYNHQLSWKKIQADPGLSVEVK